MTFGKGKMMRNPDKRQKIELAITGIGIIFLIFLVLSNMQKARQGKIAVLEAGRTVESSVLSPIASEEKETKVSEIKDGWGRDPFIFGAHAETSFGTEGLVLNGIVWDRENPYAIINNDVVKAGDSIGDITIVEINENSVVLQQNAERFTLELDVGF